MSCSACPRSHRARLDPARRALGALGGLLLTLGLLATPAQAQIVLRQIYGGGGHAYDRDFVELFNRGGATESVDGWSIQYASATGSGLFSGAAPSLLAGSLAPGQSLLVGLAASRSGAPLPTPFLAGNPATNLASTSGKVALVRSPEGLACNGGSVPCGPAQQDLLVDLVGYGAASFFEGPAAAPAASTTAALHRIDGGCSDRWANAADFALGAPLPRSSTSAPTPCPPGLAVELALSTSFASEADRTILSVTATTEAPVVGHQSVSLAIGGPGITPDDYSLTPTILALPDGRSSAHALFSVADDPFAEGTERASLLLASFSSALRPGAFIQRTLVLADDDGCGLDAVAIHAVQGTRCRVAARGDPCRDRRRRGRPLPG
jgi:hypothetical protein